MSKKLFEDFNEISAKEWKQKIQFDLKGADYNKTLVYKSHEGIDIKPFYHKEDLVNPKKINHPTSWAITEIIEVSEAQKGNQDALQAIEKGAACIFFQIKDTSVDFEILIAKFPKDVLIYVETSFLSEAYLEKIQQIASASSDFQIYVFTDIIGHLAKTGNWFHTLQKDHEVIEKIVSTNTGLGSVLSVDIGLLQNSGATIIQQLAYGLAHANEYLNYFENSKENISKNNGIVFKVAVGSNYFFEIAKLRALRKLWEILSSEYQMLKKCYIFAQPSLRNKTVQDYNVNMLRTTTECMSAILGGADSVGNIRYDAVYNSPNDFGNRIALNQLLILKNESYFHLVNNVAEGCYYIENLTNQFVEKSLELFKNIEKGGGYLKQLKSGILQLKIKESAKKEQALFDNQEITLTGSNAYQNPNEVLPNMDKSPFIHKKVRKTLLEPLISNRLSDKIEKKSL